MAAVIGIEPFPHDQTANGGWEDDEYRVGIARAKATGVGQVSVTEEWPNLELSPGEWDLTPISRIVEASAPLDVQVTVPLLKFDGTKKVPAWLANEALDSSAMRAGVLGLGTAINGIPGSSRIKVVRLANEQMTYLALNPSHINPWATCLGNAISDLGALSGWAPTVGASFKHTDIASYLSTYAAVHAVLPVAMWTYYKHHPTTYVNTLTDIPSMATTIYNDWTAMKIALGKPSIISELGYASHADLLGSEDLQASFVVSSIGVANEMSTELIDDLPAIGRIDFKFLTEFFEALLTAQDYTGNLRKFVKTLGLTTDMGRAKAALTLLTATLGGHAFTGRRSLSFDAVYKPYVLLNAELI